LDTATNTFSTVATTGDAATGDYKYSGAAAVGTSVYFAPYTQNNVGIYHIQTAAPTSAPTLSWIHRGPEEGSVGIAHGSRAPSLNVAKEFRLSDDVQVHWSSNDLEQITSHSLDWIGLYTVGACSQNHDLAASLPSQNSCYLAYAMVGGGHIAGTVTFNYADTKLSAGSYEVRYFLGDSQGGYGHVCRNLEDANGRTRCALEAVATSRTFTVTANAQDAAYEGFESMPGFELGFSPLLGGLR